MKKKIISLFVIIILILCIFRVNKTSTGSNLTDATFFGVWSGNVWVTVGKLDYDYTVNGVKVLVKVESAVKSAKVNYKAAEEELLDYMKNRTNITVPEPVEDKGLADLAVRDTFTGPQDDTYLTTVSVDNSFSTVSTDVTSSIASAYGNTNQACFMLMGAYKDSNIAEIYSKETKNQSQRPALVVQFSDGSSKTITANKDTYLICTTSKTNGSATSLLVRDSGDPVDDNSYRTYINFDLSIFPQNLTVKSAYFRFYGRNQSSGEKVLDLFLTGDSTWDEATFNWNTDKGSIYSWNGIDGGCDWNEPINGDSEYLNVICRFYFLPPMMAEHLKNPTEKVYSSNAVSLMMDFIHDKPAGYDRTLETGMRLSSWISAYQSLKDTPALSASDNTEIIKFIWQDAEFLSGQSNFDPNGNWGVIETSGFISAAIYFPEFLLSDSWFNTANDRLVGLIKKNNNPDFSYRESTTSYATLTTSLFSSCTELAKENNRTLSPELDKWLTGIAGFNMDMSYPNGFDINFGDSNYQSNSSLIYEIGQDYNNKSFIYFGSNGKEGTKPDYTSILYPQGKFAIMRTGWDINDLYSMISDNNASSHSHPDVLSMLLYAYGKPLLVDVGRYSYSSTPISNWLRGTTIAHNTIVVGGKNQIKSNTSKTNYWSTNNGADFYEGSTNGNEINGVTFPYTRSVLFVKPDFWIVSDIVDNSTATKVDMTQSWHYLPGANPTMDTVTKKVSTNFPSGANLQVIPADPSDINIAEPAAKGYYSENYGLVQIAPYTTFTKIQRGTTTYDTILYPIKPGDSKDVEVIRLELSVDTYIATALKININGSKGDYGYYYLSHEKSPKTLRKYDVYSFNGKMAYTQTDNNGKLKTASVIAGDNLKMGKDNIILSPNIIDNINVIWQNNMVAISGSSLLASDNSKTAIAIYAPNVNSVTLNGKPVKFTKAGNYIFAAVEK